MLKEVKAVINKTSILDCIPNIDYLEFTSLENIIFFDIETTGLSPKNSIVFLIGFCYFKDDKWYLQQLMAENTDEEALILNEFSDFLKEGYWLINYNGDKFDIPFLKERYSQNNIDYDVKSFKSLDIYKKAKFIKHKITITDLKQKSIEILCGIRRDDELSGSDMINLYKEYITNHNKEILNLILLHNHDDIKGLTGVINVISYSQITKKEPASYKYDMKQYLNHNEEMVNECNITLHYDISVPAPLHYNINNAFIKFEQNTIYISVKLYEGILKYFFENYKDYFYLPDEDTAVHKSVGIYVDKEHRNKATAKNCYTNKEGIFLPSFGLKNIELFRAEYSDKETFFLLDTSKLDNYEFIVKYIRCILNNKKEAAAAAD